MGPAIIARTFGQGERGKALGLNAVSVAIGLSLGPALGGLLTEFGTWRAIFFVNVPVGIFAIAWAARILPVEPAGRRQSFDILGAALSACGLFALLLALNQAEPLGWTSPLVVGLLALALILGVAFVAVERRTAAPMMDLGLFRVRAFSAGLVAVIVAFAGLFTATFLLPFILQEGSGYTPLEAGLLITPIPIAAALVAPFSGALSDRIGQRAPASLGIAVLAAGLLSLATLPAGFAVGDLVWRLALIGAGQGLFLSPNSSAILGSVPRPR
jgi:EmrB/QacA subfamily drug resistance transporter